MPYCDKCGVTKAPIRVRCRECGDEICSDCAMADEQRTQLCFRCETKKEAEDEHAIYA